MTPTVHPNPNFNDEEDATALKQAFKGLGTDEDAIIQIITQRSNEQRQQIAARFKTMYGKDVIKELKSELKGNFEDVILALMTEPIEFQAKQLHNAISGLGTDEPTIVEILSIHNNDEVVKIAQAYEGLYQQSLEEDLKGDTSGTVKRLLVALSNGHRDESETVDHEKAVTDAQTLLRAGELIQGTEESTFNAILCQRSRSQLKQIFEEYEKITGHSFDEAIENEFSLTSKESLLDLVHSIRDRTGYLTQRLHDSLAGIGTDDRTLIRIVLGRSEVDLGEIKDAFQEKYGKTLEEFVQDDCSGDYKKCLLAVIATE